MKNYDKDIFLNKIAQVYDFMSESSICSLDKSLGRLDHYFNKIQFTESPEQIADKQNIPKWWRIIYNFGIDITLSLSWASSWHKLFNKQKQEFINESGKSDFNELIRSQYFDSIAWTHAKYYLDNAIIRLHAYRDKLVKLLNVHHKLCLFSEKGKKVRFYFRNYYDKTSCLSPEFQGNM